MSKIAYIRVSTLEQNTARQREAFKDLKIDKFFEEKVSGKNILMNYMIHNLIVN